jgi:orotate phosphoribosyltransferase
MAVVEKHFIHAGKVKIFLRVCYFYGMTEIEKRTAGYLLESEAVVLRPDAPFTWASGWLSPIYCDNRITLSYPEIRSFIRNAFVETIRDHFGSPDLIAGVATGAIAQGVLVAEAMGLPFIYVRPSAKGHGRQNLIEGKMETGQRVVVVEDLISTGGSSIKAVKALQNAGAEVAGMVAIFTYGFEVAGSAFREAGVELHTLSHYHALLELALESGYVQREQEAMLAEWRKDPSNWNGQ